MRARATAFLAALLALFLAGFSPSYAQDAPLSGAPSDWTWEIPLDDIEPVPDAPELLQAEYGYGILIEGDADYIQGMTERLDGLALLPSGQRLLEELGQTGFTTTISPQTADHSGPAARPADPASAAFLVGEGGELTPGPGSDALVFMDPDSTIARTSPEIVLGHELLHALHYHQGERLTARQTEGPNAGTKFEELRTIGTDGYDDEVISENVLRTEWNELYPDDPVAPERNGHRATDWGPSRTAPGGCACGSPSHPHVQPATPSVPVAVKPQIPLEVEPLKPIDVKPIVLEPLEPLEPLQIEPLQPRGGQSSSNASGGNAEGASRILQRALSGGE